MKWTLLILLCVGLACQKPSPCECEGQATRLPTPEAASSEELMNALAQAKTLHLKADSQVAMKETAAALATVRTILDISFPANSHDAQDVKNDARARLASMYIAEQKFDQAAETINQGLDGASRDSFFVANLYTVRGQLLEAQATAAKDPASADKLRREAIIAYEKSMDINRKIQKEL